MSEAIKLGGSYRDRVTEFEGVAIARCKYLNGCVQYEIRPVGTHDGKMFPAEWIDESQLETVPEVSDLPNYLKAPDGASGKRGGPGDHPPKANMPGRRQSV